MIIISRSRYEDKLKSQGLRTDKVNLQMFCEECKKEYVIDVFMQDMLDSQNGKVIDFHYLPEDELFILRSKVCITCG